MIGYVTLGTNNFEKAAAYYDALLGTMGAGRAIEIGDRFIGWATGPGTPIVGIIKPFDGNEATVSNGGMTALVVDSPEKVDAIYKKALELGGTSEGEPGPRGPEGSNFYAGYFRDLDGNKLNIFCMG
jgi:catechol 2,3-dioxygenase-like lactoylglutathione lyase family enzyme